jgi:putative ABC transport system permease protein
VIGTRLVKQISVSFNLCLIEIWSNKLRTVITSFGIFLGVTSYLVNVAFLRGIDLDIKTNLEQIGGLNIITIKKKKASTDDEKIQFNNSNGLKLSDIEEIATSLPYIKSTLPIIDIPWEIAKAAGKNRYVKPFAVSQSYLNAYNYEVQEGRPFTNTDYTKNLSVCLIGIRIVKELFPNDLSAVGKTITLLNHTFTIVGIIKTDDQFSYKAIQFLFPYSLYTSRFGVKDGTMEEIAVELKKSDYAEKARIDFTRLLKQKHRGIEDFEVESNGTKIQEMRAASTGIKVLLTSISVITLLIGGISIMNIMFAALGDRIREIGVRKALGARRSDIFMQFIIEAIMVSFVGGLPGLFIGGCVVFFPPGVFPYTPTLSFVDYGLAVVFTLVSGIISGMSPAIRASAMQPVEALRY